MVITCSQNLFLFIGTMVYDMLMYWQQKSGIRSAYDLYRSEHVHYQKSKINPTENYYNNSSTFL